MKPTFLSQNLVYQIDSIPNRPQAHAANLIKGETKDTIQTLYCAWFCGTREGNEDVAILFSEIRYNINQAKNASTSSPLKIDYSTPRVIAKLPGKASGNPVLFLDPNEIMHLWFPAFPPRQEKFHNLHRDIYHQTSPDYGKTWSEPTIFSDRSGLWVKNPVLVLSDGTWILPMNDETTFNWRYQTYWSSRFAFSYDQGKTWSFSKLYSIKKGMIQPCIVELQDGSLYCINRSRTGWIVEMRSYDKGKTWTKAKNTALPNPNANSCMILRKKGDILLIFNPVHKGRTPISIARSKDDGKTWERLFDLQATAGEYSYPCILETNDGLIHVVYTHRRLTISHDVFKID